MKKQIQTRVPIRALAGGVGLLTTLGLGLSMGQAASAKTASTKTASAKSAPHFRVSAAQATATVLKKFPGQLTEKTRLENEEGTWQYGVMVKSGHTLREVMVDAKTGVIADVEATTASKEQVEKKTDAADATNKASAKKSSKAAMSHR